MIVLADARSLRAVQRLPFCYLCGDSIDGAAVNREHVFAKKSFKVPDRANPLILLAHEKCNTAKSDGDERVAQILSAGRGDYPSAKNQRVRPQAFALADRSAPLVGVTDDLVSPVWSWVQGCHAALYRRPLLLDTVLKAVDLPFVPVQITSAVLRVEPIRPQQLVLVDVIKRNRITRSTDRIQCNNGRCRFECVWIQFDDGRWGCVFAITVDGWEDLARCDLQRRQCCVGFYKPVTGRPANAARDTRLVFVTPNSDPLDPFDERVSA